MSAQAILLGTGTSNGVPMLTFDYPDSFLANPKNHRTRSSVLLQGPQGNVLVDCAPELRLQLLREGVKTLEAVVLTHTHADHLMGMDDLRPFCMRTGRNLPVYTTPEYQDDVRRVFRYAFFESTTGEVPRFDLRDAPPVLEVAGLSIRLFTVWHGPVPVLGLRVNDFAYLTDVSSIPPDADVWLRGLDTLVLDAVRYKPHPNHFHLEAAIAEAQRIGARQTFFTHLSHDFDHDPVDASLPPGIHLAYDGLRVPI